MTDDQHDADAQSLARFLTRRATEPETDAEPRPLTEGNRAPSEGRTPEERTPDDRRAFARFLQARAPLG